MKTKAEIFEEERVLIDQIKDTLSSLKRPIKDPQNLLTPLKVDRSVTRWEHIQRRNLLRDLLNNIKNLIRIEVELHSITSKKGI